VAAPHVGRPPGSMEEVSSTRIPSPSAPPCAGCGAVAAASPQPGLGARSRAPSPLVPATTAAPPASPSSSPLSPTAPPFFPAFSGGRSKSQRWADDDGEEPADDRRASYVDVVRRPQKPMASALPCAQPVVDTDRGRADAGRHGSRRRWRKRSQPRPQLVLGLPARPVDGRIPARQRLGRCVWVSVPDTVATERRNKRRVPRRTPVHQRLGPKVTEHLALRCRPRRFSSPNADGWREVLPRRKDDNSADVGRHPASQPAAAAASTPSGGAERPMPELPLLQASPCRLQATNKVSSLPRIPASCSLLQAAAFTTNWQLGCPWPRRTFAGCCCTYRRQATTMSFEMPGADKGQHLGYFDYFLW
jgi:hypothetical protein